MGTFIGHGLVLIIRIFIAIAGWVPLRFGLAVMKRVADLILILGFKKSTILKNLDYIYEDRLSKAEKWEIAKGANRNAFLMVFECLRVASPRATKEGISHLRWEDPEFMDTCESDPRACLFAVAHSGNFDLAADEWMLTRERPGGVVMKPLENKALNDLLIEIRTMFKCRVISSRSANAIEEINAFLKTGSHLCILPDQNAKRRGVVVNFLGKPCSTFKGPARTWLENREHTRLIVAVPYRCENDVDHVVQTEEITDFEPSGDNEADVQALTERITDIMTRMVFNHPESYLWHHRRWWKGPDGEPVTASLAVHGPKSKTANEDTEEGDQTEQAEAEGKTEAPVENAPEAAGAGQSA